MPHAEVDVTVGDDAPGDDVTFLIAANPGLPLLPLSRVASGGELARTMLALRLVLTEAPETLVFDEVDAGIGGAAATAVGRGARPARAASPGDGRHPSRPGGSAGRRADRGDQDSVEDGTVTRPRPRAQRSTATNASTRSPGCSVVSRQVPRPGDTLPTYWTSACVFRDERIRNMRRIWLAARKMIAPPAASSQ